MKPVNMALMLKAPVGLWGHVCPAQGRFVARYTPNWPIFTHIHQRAAG